MTRALAVLFLSLALAGLTLVGCSPSVGGGGGGTGGGGGGGGTTNADIVGTWKLAELVMNNGTLVPTEQVPSVALEFKADGTGKNTEQGVTTDFTYILTGNQVEVKWADSRPAPTIYTLSGSTLIEVRNPPPSPPTISKLTYRKA